MTYRGFVKLPPLALSQTDKSLPWEEVGAERRNTPPCPLRSSISSACCCGAAWARSRRIVTAASDCGRTPLVGERVHLYERSSGHRLRALPAAAPRAPRRERARAPLRARPHRAARRARGVGSPPAVSIDSRSMDPVTVSILIDAPREEVFDYLQDSPTTPSSPTTIWSTGISRGSTRLVCGAGARFRVKAPGNRFSWADVTFVEVERPHRIVEAGRTGKTNRIRTLGVYELAPRREWRHARSLHARDRAGDALRSDHGELRRAQLDQAQEQARDAPPARDHRGRSGCPPGRRARDGGRRIDCRIACAPVRQTHIQEFCARRAEPSSRR